MIRSKACTWGIIPSQLQKFNRGSLWAQRPYANWSPHALENTMAATHAAAIMKGY
jgi:hypothetical protein